MTIVMINYMTINIFIMYIMKNDDVKWLMKFVQVANYPVYSIRAAISSIAIKFR